MQSAVKNGPAVVSIPEFGPISNRQLDVSKAHHGGIYSAPTGSLKHICDATGFSAQFENTAIRTACMDIHGGEANVVIESDRNAKPSDVAVRYSRDRWTVQEVATKIQEGSGSWTRSEYHAGSMDEDTLAAIAAQLKLDLTQIADCYLRINFKKHVFILISDEEHIDLLPQGPLSSFTIPAQEQTSGMSTMTNETMETAAAAETPEAATVAPSETAAVEAQTAGTEPTAEAVAVATSEVVPTAEPVATAESADSPAASEPAVSVAPTEYVPAAKPEEAAHVATSTELTAPVASTTISAAAGSTAIASSDASTGPAHTSSTTVTVTAPAPTPLAMVAASARKPQVKASTQAVVPPPEERIQPKRNERSSSYSSSRSDYSQGEAKYATYSKSEVDALLKQQADMLLSALSGKMSAQQRVFQEAVTSQEKQFNKTSSEFIAQFEAARVKLEQTIKQSQDHSKKELEGFNTELHKELEDYKKHINKTVLPVTKAIEGKTLPTGGQKDAAKEVKVAPKVQQALTAAHAKLERLVMLAVVLSAVSALLSLVTLMSHAH